MQIPGAGEVLRRQHSVLDAGLSKENCIKAFAAAGITPAADKQYHRDWLDSKFDEDGLLRAGEHLLPGFTCKVSPVDTLVACMQQCVAETVFVADNAAGNARECTRNMKARYSAIHSLTAATAEARSSNAVTQHIQKVAEEAQDPLRIKIRTEGAAAAQVNSKPAMLHTAEATLAQAEADALAKEQALAEKERKRGERKEKQAETKRRKEEHAAEVAERKKMREAKKAQKQTEKAERAARKTGKKKGAGAVKRKRSVTPDSNGSDSDEGQDVPCATAAPARGRRNRQASRRALEGAEGLEALEGMDWQASPEQGDGKAEQHRRRRAALGDITNRQM